MTKEDVLAVVHVEDYSGIENISYRARIRSGADRNKLSIIDTSGNPILGASVQFDRHVDGDYIRVGHAMSNAEGKVAIPKVKDAKPLYLRVEASGYVSRRSSHSQELTRNADGEWFRDVCWVPMASRWRGRRCR